VSSAEAVEAIVIGAGPAGLACAAMMKSAGLAPVVLERASAVGAVWRRHYDRLHLHTDRGHSGLPGLSMPREYPKYPSRKQVVDYLEAYARHFGLTPRLETPAKRIAPANGGWRVETGSESFAAPVVVVATGTAGWPVRPNWPGADGFPGDIVHSSEYRNPAPYAGKRVLVVGFGNSGGEIALDLAEKGIDVALAVRSPVRIVPRDLLGLPILTWAILLQRLPPRLADAVSAPLVRLSVGSLHSLGLRPAAKGPITMVEEDGRVPLLDIGTVAAVREGKIAIRPGVERFEGENVVFSDGASAPYDAVILATGYKPDLRPLLPEVEGVLDAAGQPRVSGGTTGQPGLYFCSFRVAATGQLREIGIEAKRIAALAKAHIARTL
jgi:cation diffusion facilitator CzcD-associated flavoprotein CzcO